MSKEIDILTILYPRGIVAGDICEVYETVMPKIRQLVDGVAIGYDTAVDNVVPIAPDTVHEDVRGKCDGCDTPCVQEDDVQEEVTTDGKYTFTESDRHTEAGWHEESYKNSKYLKSGDDVVIRTKSSRIDTTWKYLCEFYRYLADETKLSTIAGLNRPKATALIEFYEAHPNFPCEIVKSGTAKIFKKVDVRVGMATHGEGEPIAAADYEISAY